MAKEDRWLKKGIDKQTLLFYSIAFILMSTLIYSYFVIKGQSFIWDGDGLSQHYLLFYDYVDKLQGLFKGEGFALWDWSIGMGADTITSYGYYVIGDPFVYLGVLFPPALRELAYHLLILLRMWCVGGSYLLLARKMSLSHGAGLIGSVMYAFSHYVIYNVTRHPFFILPMIFYPLLCLGVEKLFKKESGVLFAVMVAISAISNFYFFYKLTLLTLLFGIVRYYSLFGLKDVKQLVKMLWRCLCLYAIGILISAVLFLPIVGGFLTSSRSPEGASINMLFYPLNYYYLLLVNAFTPGTYLWTVGGFSFFALFAILFLWRWRKKKEYRFVFLALISLGILILFPFFGSLMNGLAGPYNRFTFAFPFYLALASGWFFDNRDSLKRTDHRQMTAALIFFTVISLIQMVLTDMVLFYVLPLLIGWGMLGTLVKEQSQNSIKGRSSSVFIVLVMLNMAVNAMVFYYPFGKNAMAETIDYGEAEKSYASVFGELETYLPEDELYRVGVTSRDNHVRNQFIYLDTMGLNSYLSITDGDLAGFAYELETGAFQVIQPLRNGFDDRRIVNHLLGVRYIITEAENEAYLPFGYDVVQQSEEEPSFIIAETQHAYPFAYVENTWMPYSEFNQLNPVEKEAFLAEGVVLDDHHSIDGLSLFDGNLAVDELAFEIESVDGQLEQIGDSQFDVLTDDGQLIISFLDAEETIGKEVYLHLEGLDYEPLTESVLVAPNTSYRLRVRYGEQEKSILQSDRFSFSSYFHRENMLFHMGHVDEAEETMTLQFDDAGHYQLETITAYALDVDEERDEAIAAQKEAQALSVSTFTDGTIVGQLNQTNPSLLVTSIPYTSGWKAQVNGEEVDTVKTNIGFIGIPLPAGEVEVELTYQTPLLTAGMGMSLLGLALLAIYRFVLFPKNQLTFCKKRRVAKK
ncbi:YfhO family protein [Alkalibacterium sp. MB6]|uniref:YfhO family protein n=1 Tax=Alkalibacterium sp. MB6 TaxID=2081965 RepID=UPI0013798D40|nr:YfhO family protein [Alkalibacterium sp. MB6]